MHKFNLKILIAIILAILIEPLTYEQSDSKLEVKFEKQDNGEILIYGINNSNEPYVFFVDFFKLTSLSPNVELPHVETVYPGKSLLFTLLPFGISPPSYSRRVRFFKGVLANEQDLFHYSLPVSTKKEALFYSTIDTSRIEPTIDYRQYIYGLVVKAETYDTLFASRAGKVLSISSTNAIDPVSKEETGETFHSIRIQHKDNSTGHYRNVLPNKSLAKEGDYVLQGQPIALFSDNTNNQVYFNVSGMIFNRDEEDILKAFSQNFQFVNFKVDEGEPILILDSAKYTGYLTDEMIIQEMSNREKKKYLKDKVK